MSNQREISLVLDSDLFFRDVVDSLEFSQIDYN